MNGDRDGNNNFYDRQFRALPAFRQTSIISDNPNSPPSLHKWSLILSDTGNFGNRNIIIPAFSAISCDRYHLHFIHDDHAIDTIISPETIHPVETMMDEVPRIPAFMQQMGESIIKTAGSLDKNQMDAFFNQMLDAKRVYVAGAGRSGFIAKAFGLRLMHLGFDAYVVGETITPAFHDGDTLVVFSGSGETQSMVSICETAKELHGKVCLITSSPDSRMSRIADCVVNLGDLTGYYHRDKNSFEIRQLTGMYRSVTSVFAPLGTLFETLALVFSDAIISSLMEAKKAEVSELQRRLTNVE